MKKLFIILFFLYLSTNASAQNFCIDCEVDSINQILLKTHTPKDTLYSLVAVIDNIGGSDLIGSTDHHKKVVSIVNELVQLNNRLKLIDTNPYELYRDGVLLWDRNERGKSIEKLKEAIDAFDQQKKIFGGYGLLNLIRAYFNSDGEERLRYYQEKLRYYQDNGRIENTAPCYHAIAGYYYYKADYDLAISNYLKAADVYKNYSPVSYCNEIYVTGLSYFNWGNYDRAQYFLQTGYELSLKTRSWYTAEGTQRSLALIDKQRKDYQGALQHINEALKILNLNPDPASMVIDLTEKGGILLEMNEYEKAYELLSHAKSLRDSISLPMVTNFGNCESEYFLHKYYHAKGDDGNAEKQLLAAYYKATEAKSDGLIQKYRKELITFYMAIGKPEKATSFAISYITFGDSLRDAQNEYNIAKFENEQKAWESEKEVQGLQTQKKQQRNYSIAGGIFLLLLSVAIFSRLQFIRKMKRKLEEKNILIEKEKLRAEQSERFKQQFLANMSHEIRTPMNAVMGMTNLLIGNSPRLDQQQYLAGIKKSSDTLLHILNDILDLSKIEAGKIELENIDFSLLAFVGQIEQLLQHKADEKGIQLITQIDQNIPVLKGDPVRLFQVLMNLIGNAIKFTEKGSVQIEIKTKGNDQVFPLPVRFSIIDTGIGIPKDKLETVFENFSQATTSDTRKYGGTGLGLSISKQLIELMGGTIAIESEEGKGTCFSFMLAFEKGSAERLQQTFDMVEGLDGSILNGLKILIADDNEYNLIVATDTLKLNADVTVMTASNGNEVIKLLKENNFDVILMDIQMPELDGFEATRYIRSHFTFPKRDIPIIACTASVLRTDLDKCTEAGMNAYISKPFNANQLIRGIADVMGIKIKPFQNIRKTDANDLKSSGSNGSVTDLTYLKDFCEGDLVRMEKYIAIFLETAPMLVKKINSAITISDYIEIASQIHGFKTKFIMIGMNNSKDLAMKIEIQCAMESPDHASIKANTSRLINFVEEAIIELKQKSIHV